MIDRGTFAEASARLGSWARTLILTHDRPDGDALGAVVAMKRIIAGAGRESVVLLAEPCPGRYAFMAEGNRFEVSLPDRPETMRDRFDGILILDTCSRSQLAPFQPVLSGCPLPRLVVDHHATRDDLSDAGAKVTYLIDPQAASACSLLYRWCATMGWPIDRAVAESLFIGLVTDTGWFRFSNTDADTFATAGKLVGCGARPHVVYNRLYEMWPAARLRLRALVLSTLTLHAEDRLAVMHLEPGMFAESGASVKETEELVNEPMTMASVVASVLLVDEADNRVRVSFRSKAPEVCGLDVDVAALAARFGGGGHHRAAGARVTGQLDTVREHVVEAVTEAIDASAHA